MLHKTLFQSYLLLISFSFSYFGFAQNRAEAFYSTAIQSPDEASLRTIVEEFYAMYPKKDLQGFLRLWSEKSPDLAARRKAMEKLFADNDKVEVKSVMIGRTQTEGEYASLRATVELSAGEARAGNPAREFGKMNRAFRFVKEDGRWKILRELSVAEDIARALAAAKSENERAALLAADSEFVTSELCRALIAQGEGLTTLGDVKHAVSICNLAMTLAEKLDDKQGIGLSLMAIGNAYAKEGNYLQAAEYHRRAATMAEKAGDVAQQAEALKRLGRVNVLHNDYSLALENFNQSMSIRKSQGDKVKIAEVLFEISTVYLLRGEFDQFQDVANQMLILYKELDSKRGIASVMNSLAMAYAETGSPDLAIRYFKESLQVRSELGDKSAVAILLGNIGVTYLQQGNYRLALEYCQQSLRQNEEIKSLPPTGAMLGAIGEIYMREGNYDIALDYFTRRLALYEKMSSKGGIAAALSNLGDVYRLQGDFMKSVEAHRKSLTITESSSQLRKQHALSQKNIGIAYRLNGEGSKAMEYFEKALAEFEGMRLQIEIADTLSNMSTIYHSQGKYEKALASAQRAILIAEQSRANEKLWEAKVVAGKIHLSLGNPDQAQQQFDEAVRLIEQVRSHYPVGELDSHRFFEYRISPFNEVVKLLVAQHKSAEALLYAERSKARTLLEVLQNGKVNINKEESLQEQEQERQLINQITFLNTQITRESANQQPDPIRLADFKSRLQSARLHHEKFQSNLYAAHPELKWQRGQTQNLNLEQIMELIPDAKGALVEYLVTDEKTILFVVTRKIEGNKISADLRAYSIAIKRGDLKKRVEQFRQQLASRDLAFREPARALYDLLLKPAQLQLQGKTNIVIVPDDSLWELPFQALQPAVDRYLIEDSALSYAPSLSVLREMIQHRKQQMKTRALSGSLLAFGNPALSGETVARVQPVNRDERLGPLPDAEKEVKALAELYGAQQSKVYIGAEAREDRVKAEANKFTVLHFATHGVFNDVSPMYSHLVLSQAGGNDDGLLEAWEIMKLDLHADMVVLSACETARGRVRAGEGVIGLTWAMFVAGSSTVVVSQWKVESASTSELMLDFYRTLNSKTKTAKSEALRAAALKMLKRGQYRHPFYWAGFVIVGDGS
jgi:CHAT domain-containing protein/uncharacterized protein HemY